MGTIKKVLKWYFKQSAQSYTWLPSGMIPPLG